MDKYVVAHQCSCGSFTAIVEEEKEGRRVIRRMRVCSSCPKTKDLTPKRRTR